MMALPWLYIIIYPWNHILFKLNVQWWNLKVMKLKMFLRPVPTRSAPLSGTEIRCNGSLQMAGITWHPEFWWECHSTITQSALVSIPSPNQPWSVWAATLYTTAPFLPLVQSSLIWWRATASLWPGCQICHARPRLQARQHSTESCGVQMVGCVNGEYIYHDNNQHIKP